MKIAAAINVIRYDLIVNKPSLTYEQLIQLKKEVLKDVKK